MKIGFACDWLDSFEQKNRLDKNSETSKLHTKTTTLTWINKQSNKIKEQKLFDLMVHNIQSIDLLIKKVSDQKEIYKMVRLGSDILPFYTEKNQKYFYQQEYVKKYLHEKLSKIGEYARKKEVRLSMHPGQFCCLASDNPLVVENSIEELEYHVDIAKYMGYAGSFQDFKINVHISGKKGVEGFKEAYKKLSVEARNCLTIENEENKHGLDSCLELFEYIPVVLDIHHHWVKENEYIGINDNRIKKIKDSWKDKTPVIHYSNPKQEYLETSDPEIFPIHTGNKMKLRSHSDYFWNRRLNEYILEFVDEFDIMCESKAKNLASMKII